MRRPHGWLAAAFVAACLWACHDVPAPESGVFSVSALQLPSPAVVAGDTMRDSAGHAAQLQVIAYDVAGLPLDPQPSASFVLLDTGGAHLAGAYLVGDQAARTVRIVGNVAGLQTLPVIVPVTLEPDTLVPSDSTHQTHTFSLLAGDTAVNADLNVQVRNTAATPAAGVDGVIVYYEITRSPPVVGSGASVVLLNSGAASSRDTTSGGGRASRTLRLRLAAAAPTTDSASVRVTASYRGQSLGNVQFTVVFKAQ